MAEEYVINGAFRYNAERVYAPNMQLIYTKRTYGKFAAKAEVKVMWHKFLDSFEIKSIEMVGYPDYLEYEIEDGREVPSRWKYNLVRKWLISVKAY